MSTEVGSSLYCLRCGRELHQGCVERLGPGGYYRCRVEDPGSVHVDCDWLDYPETYFCMPVGNRQCPRDDCRQEVGQLAVKFFSFVGGSARATLICTACRRPWEGLVGEWELPGLPGVRGACTREEQRRGINQVRFWQQDGSCVSCPGKAPLVVTAWAESEKLAAWRCECAVCGKREYREVEKPQEPQFFSELRKAT